jgi:hypothetical protein
MGRARPVTDFVVCALGVLMVIVYAVGLYHHATLDHNSTWCDPHLVVCGTGHHQ